MTVDSPWQTGVALAIFGSLEALLLLSFSTRSQDLRLLGTGMLLVLAVVVGPIPVWLEQVTTRRTPAFNRAFRLLSLCEVIFTLVLPWILLLRRKSFHQHEDILVPHMLIFQGQIFSELVLFLTRRRQWLFLFTCGANICRLGSILFWIQQATQPVDQILSLVAILLWLYGSLVFIPFVWFPCLSRKKLSKSIQSHRLDPT